MTIYSSSEPDLNEMGKEVLEQKRTWKRYMDLTEYHKTHNCNLCSHTLYDHVYTCENALDMNCSRIPVCIHCGCQRILANM